MDFPGGLESLGGQRRDVDGLLCKKSPTSLMDIVFKYLGHQVFAVNSSATSKRIEGKNHLQHVVGLQNVDLSCGPICVHLYLTSDEFDFASSNWVSISSPCIFNCFIAVMENQSTGAAVVSKVVVASPAAQQD